MGKDSEKSSGSGSGGSPGSPDVPGGGGGERGGGDHGSGSSNEKDMRFPMDNLHLDWDNHGEIRARLRNGGTLMKHWDTKQRRETDVYVEKLVENLRVNSCVLSPVFKLMAKHDRALPCIDNLMQQVDKLFDRSKIRFTNHQDRVYQETWAIRRLCSLAKAQVYRDGPPKDLLMEPSFKL